MEHKIKNWNLGWIVLLHTNRFLRIIFIGWFKIEISMINQKSYSCGEYWLEYSGAYIFNNEVDENRLCNKMSGQNFGINI